jgi:hypothetical protein
MPRTILLSEYSHHDTPHRRRLYLINLFRNIPCTTSSVYPIDGSILTPTFKIFLILCGPKSPIPDLFNGIQDTCGYPWCKGVNVSMRRGQTWTRAFMAAALMLSGFLGEVQGDGTWKGMTKGGMRDGVWNEMVKTVLVEEVVEDWLPIYDRLWEEAKTMAGKAMKEKEEVMTKRMVVRRRSKSK